MYACWKIMDLDLAKKITDHYRNWLNDPTQKIPYG